MSLIESNVRVDDRLKHQSCHPFDRGGSVGRVTTVCVRAPDDEGPYALTAAELASIESNKTREKLKIKADHVSANSEVLFNRLSCNTAVSVCTSEIETQICCALLLLLCTISSRTDGHLLPTPKPGTRPVRCNQWHTRPGASTCERVIGIGIYNIGCTIDWMQI